MKTAKRLMVALVLWRAFAPVISPRFRPPQEHPLRSSGRTVFVGDQEFLVRESGPDGAKVVVLIHGLAGSSLAEWYRIAPVLAEKYRVVMVDYRSHGLAVPRNPWTQRLQPFASPAQACVAAYRGERVGV